MHYQLYATILQGDRTRQDKKPTLHCLGTESVKSSSHIAAAATAGSLGTSRVYRLQALMLRKIKTANFAQKVLPRLFFSIP